MSTDDDAPESPVRMSVVVAAHNEAAVIDELLGALLSDDPSCVQVVVACNGCTDRTAERARGYGPSVVVLELPVASKGLAQRAGDAVAQGFPRAYVDADIVISQPDLLALGTAVTGAGFLAAAPERDLDSTESSWVVRRYYRIWQQLPQVREGLFGRGVIVVSEAGASRLEELPLVMSDDLAMSEAFTAGERCIVPEARVRIRLPRATADLVRRRVRVATGNAQADQLGLRSAASATSVGTLLSLVRSRPTTALSVIVFLAVTVVARYAARRRVKTGDFTTWLRDESSRAAPQG